MVIHPTRSTPALHNWLCLSAVNPQGQVSVIWTWFTCLNSNLKSIHKISDGCTIDKKIKQWIKQLINQSIYKLTSINSLFSHLYMHIHIHWKGHVLTTIKNLYKNLLCSSLKMTALLRHLKGHNENWAKLKCIILTCECCTCTTRQLKYSTMLYQQWNSIPL